MRKINKMLKLITLESSPTPEKTRPRSRVPHDAVQVEPPCARGRSAGAEMRKINKMLKLITLESSQHLKIHDAISFFSYMPIRDHPFHNRACQTLRQSGPGCCAECRQASGSAGGCG